MQTTNVIINTFISGYLHSFYFACNIFKFNVKEIFGTEKNALKGLLNNFFIFNIVCA